MKSPRVFAEQGAYEIFSLLCYLVKALLVKLPLSSCDQGQGLCITVSLERRFPTEPGNHRKKVEKISVEYTSFTCGYNLCPLGGTIRLKL